MKRAFLLTWLFVGMTAIFAGPLAAEPRVAEQGTGEPFEPRSADRAVLDRAIAESRVATEPPRPGVSLYISDAGITFSTWLAEIVERWLPGFGRLADWFLTASWGLLLAVLAVTAAILLFGVARRWWRGRARPQPVAVTALPATGAARWPAERWEEEIRRLLAEGDVAAAAEALWWWLASVVAGRDVDPSWTSRELIARAGRADLGPQVLRLDRLIYGPGSPPADEVGRLFRDLREVA